MSANGANGTENANYQVTQKLLDELNDSKALVRSLKRKLVKEKKRRKTLEGKLQKIEGKLQKMEGEAEEMKERIKSLEEDNADLAAAPKKYKRLMVIEDSEEEDNADLAAAPKKYKRIMVIEDSEDEN